MQIRHYCVLSTKSGKVLYEGTSELKTADKSVPGTVYGYGHDTKSAWLDAESTRLRLIHAEKRLCP